MPTSEVKPFVTTVEEWGVEYSDTGEVVLCSDRHEAERLYVRLKTGMTTPVRVVTRKHMIGMWGASS